MHVCDVFRCRTRHGAPLWFTTCLAHVAGRFLHYRKCTRLQRCRVLSVWTETIMKAALTCCHLIKFMWHLSYKSSRCNSLVRFRWENIRFLAWNTVMSRSKHPAVSFLQMHRCTDVQWSLAWQPSHLAVAPPPSPPPLSMKVRPLTVIWMWRDVL